MADTRPWWKRWSVIELVRFAVRAVAEALGRGETPDSQAAVLQEGGPDVAPAVHAAALAEDKPAAPEPPCACGKCRADRGEA